jgi:hypothetical protein
VKILFIARHFTYFRNFDTAIRELAARGHHVHLAVEKGETLGGEAAMQALARAVPNVTTGVVPERRVDTWSGVARRLRLGLDYLRYLEPFYDANSLRRERARGRTPRLLIALADPPLVGGARWRRWFGRLLHRFDAAVPPPASVVDYIRERQPDALLITPLVDLGSQQIDYVRAARQLGVPTALAVWSWDHLTSKAYLREYPERVLVWNETQRREAVDVHGVPAGRVVVTGAQCFDHWFGRQPSRPREEFCAGLGFPVARPIVLYVGTALIKGSPPEAEYAREWVASLRQSGDPVLAGASILLRPHPQQTWGWNEIDWSPYGAVAVWGGTPVDERTRSDYFDSLFHSSAVVGVNTSVFIEAAIIGREVLAVIVPRFRDTQEGTAHFRYLMQVGGGVIRVGRDPAMHLAQLGEALRRQPGSSVPNRDFIEGFVRPAGIDTPATPAFVAAVEGLEGCTVEQPAGGSGWWRRAVLGAAVRLTSKVAGESLIRSPRELDPARQARIAAAQGEQQRKKAG